MKKRVDELQPGDMLDLEGDFYADNGHHPEFEFMYQPVWDVERETPDCLVVHCDNFSCGFPPYHVVAVADPTV